MMALNNYFGPLAQLSMVAFVILAAGALAVRVLAQPAEKIRAIQGTLAVLILALVLRQSGLVPALPVRWSGPHEIHVTQTQLDAATTTNVDPISVASPNNRKPADPRIAKSPSLAGSDSVKVTSSLPARTSIWPLAKALCVALALLGACWRIIFWLAGRRSLAQLIRASRPVDGLFLTNWRERGEAARQHVRVLESPSIDLPLTCGIWRPVIILPSALLGPTASSQLHECLEHEWAHVAHGDALTWFFVRLLDPLLWFQPFFWRLKRELRVCQDQLADESVVQMSGDRTSYAELLASLTRRHTAWTAIPALSMWDRPSHLRRRIESLLSDSIAVRLTARRHVLAATLAALASIALLVAALGSTATEANEKSSATKIPAEKPLAKDGATLSYNGKIVDARTKKPLPGAKVAIRRLSFAGAREDIIAETNHTTDQAGGFQFSIPPEQIAQPRLYLDFGVKHPGYVSIQRAGMSLAGLRRNEKLGTQPFFTKLGLQPSDPVTGRIRDPDGRPLAGVKVRAYTSTSRENINGGHWPVVESDSDGRFSIEAVEGGPVIVGIVPEKFAPEQIILEAKHGDQGDIKLEPGIPLTGIVLDANDKPVSRVWVNVYDNTEGEKIKMSVMTSISRSGLTDENGKFTLGPLKEHRCQIRIEDSPSEAGYRVDELHNAPKNTVTVNDVFLVEDIDLTEIDTALPLTVKALPYVNVRGRFIDSSGKATTGWEISTNGQIGEKWNYARWSPDANGVFTGKLPVGLKQAQFDAISDDYHAMRARLRPGEPLRSGRDFELGEIESDLMQIEIVKYDSPVVQVSVKDDAGAPIKDARLAALFDNGDPTFTPTKTMLPTNIHFEKSADGRYHSEQMVPDVKTTITAKAEGYEDASETVSLPEGAERQITLTLKKKQDKSSDTKGALLFPKNVDFQSNPAIARKMKR
jgi:beta-lactamase regulating signal transducer with metallopeptidase domain